MSNSSNHSRPLLGNVHSGSGSGSWEDLLFYFFVNRDLVNKWAKAYNLRQNSRKLWFRHANGGSFAPLDGLRAMAVIWVLLYHLAKAPLKGNVDKRQNGHMDVCRASKLHTYRLGAMD